MGSVQDRRFRRSRGGLIQGQRHHGMPGMITIEPEPIVQSCFHFYRCE
jgi:hypothetical protein